MPEAFYRYRSGAVAHALAGKLDHAGEALNTGGAPVPPESRAAG
jgi:hypothetical protein